MISERTSVKHRQDSGSTGVNSFMHNSILKLPILYKHVEDFVSVRIHYAHPEILRISGKLTLRDGKTR